MKNVVVAGYVRSPFTPAIKGALAKVRADDMLAEVIKEFVKRLHLQVSDLEDFVLGCSFPEGEQGLNLARLVVLHAGLPLSVGGNTINRFCGSSMQAIHQAVGAIIAGAGDVYLCGGVETMSRIPMGGFNPMPNPDLYEKSPGAYISMGETAENVAKRYNISRTQQDEFAVTSHQKSAKAQATGHFDQEIIPIHAKGQVIDRDGCIRPDTTLDVLAGLKPAFDVNGSVTAGTSSPLTDGCALTLICSEDYAGQQGLDILARVKSFAVQGCDPDLMGIGPVGATHKALKRAKLTIDDIDIIELNEAFASQALACIHDLHLDQAKINLDGGAIALGHPLGATGARIVGKAASLLKREGKRYALATQCIGGGQGIATILEAV
ncbi:MAG: thiolase family protein [Janthinobacterium lividum]